MIDFDGYRWKQTSKSPHKGVRVILFGAEPGDHMDVCQRVCLTSLAGKLESSDASAPPYGDDYYICDVCGHSLKD